MTVDYIFLLFIDMLLLFSMEYTPLRKSNNIIKDYFIDTTSNFKSKVTNNHHIIHRGGGNNDNKYLYRISYSSFVGYRIIMFLHIEVVNLNYIAL